MRVVFDTNIFISALVIPKSLAEKAIFKRDYPFITGDDVKAALLYAAKRLAHEEVYVA